MPHTTAEATSQQMTFGEWAADRVAGGLGSWRFIGLQTLVIVVWITFNSLALFRWHWDPAPFILLNLLFSTQAAYAAPILQLSGNRQAQKDREQINRIERVATLAEQHTEQLNRIETQMNATLLDMMQDLHALAAGSGIALHTMPPPPPAPLETTENPYEPSR